MSECARYAEARADLMAAAIAATVRGGGDGQAVPVLRPWHDASHDERAVMLLSADSPPELVVAVHAYLHRVFKTRAAVMRARAEAATAAAAAAAAAMATAAAAAAAERSVRPMPKRRCAAATRRLRARARARASLRAREEVPGARAREGDGNGSGGGCGGGDGSAGGGGDGGGGGDDHDRDPMTAAPACDGREDHAGPARTAPGQRRVSMGAGGMRMAAASAREESGARARGSVRAE